MNVNGKSTHFVILSGSLIITGRQRGDASIFSDEWLTAIAKVLKTFKEQQRKEDPKGPYRFQRKTERALDTMTNDGWGNPVKPVG